MSTFQINSFAPSLMKFTDFVVVIPNDVIPEMKIDNPHYDRPMKTLYLLHGFSGSHLDWLTGSRVSELSAKYNMAVVMPSGNNSFYVNMKGTGNAYEDFICKDLVSFMISTFHVSDHPEDIFIGGLSMGGFGAIHTGLDHPEIYGKMFGLSSALIIHDIEGMKSGTANPIADYDYYYRTFGDLDIIAKSNHNPEVIVKKRQQNGETIQPIYMACGSEDFLIENNRSFRDFLNSQKVDLTYQESPGIHNWDFWNAYLEPAMKWLVE